MMFRKKLVAAVLGASVSVVMLGCGGDSGPALSTGLSELSGATSGSGTVAPGTGVTTTGSVEREAHTIVLTYPNLDSIENLGGGVYRRIGKAVVNDNEGNPVPDGTKVYFNVIDSVVAQGSIDSVSGSSMTDANPTLGDGATPTTFDTAYVIRNQAYDFVEPSDHIFLTSLDNSANAEPVDQNRIISSAAATTLTVTQNYINDYPNATYPADTTDYVIGVSALGAQVVGLDDEGELVNAGYSVTKDGIATFYVTYPATVETIGTGCVDPADDTRASPTGSARVYLVASAGTEATTIDDQFCFSSIAGWTLTALDATTISSSSSITFLLEDGGDTVSLPFRYASASVTYTTNTGGLNIIFDDPIGNGAGRYRTNTSGVFTSNITVAGGASGDAATITYSTLDTSTEITVSIP